MFNWFLGQRKGLGWGTRIVPTIQRHLMLFRRLSEIAKSLSFNNKFYLNWHIWVLLYRWDLPRLQLVQKLDCQLPAASITWFLSFFRAGEITSPSFSDKASSMAMGDVSVDSHTVPTMLKVHLKYSKTDQWGKVFYWATNNSLCPNGVSKMKTQWICIMLIW